MDDIVTEYGYPKAIRVITGRSSSQGSVINGIEANGVGDFLSGG